MPDAQAVDAADEQDFLSLPELAAKYPSFVVQKDWVPATSCISPATDMISILLNCLDPLRVKDHHTLVRMCRLLQIGGQTPPEAGVNSFPKELADFIKEGSKLKGGRPFVYAEVAKDWFDACDDIHEGEGWKPLADALFTVVFKRLCNYNAVTKWFERSNFKVTDWAGFGHLNSQGEVEPRSRAEVHTTYENLYYWQRLVQGKSDETGEDIMTIKSKKFLTAWFMDGKMKTYKKVDCIAPSKHGRAVPAGVLNAWPGYRAEQLPPVPADLVLGLVKPIFDHLRLVICSTEEEFQFFIAWLAQHIQDPANKTGVGILLLGDQGVGKDIIPTWYIKKILGSRVGLQVGKVSHIFGEHSTLLQNKVMCVLDEADPATLSPHMSTLKDMMTADNLSCNPKGKKLYTIENVSNFLITSNNVKKPVSLESTDRRFAAFACNDSKRGDTAYFNTLGQSLNDRSARALYQFLTEFDLSAYGSFQAKRPETQIYRQLKEMHLPIFYSFLSHECVRYVGVETQFVSASSIFEDLMRWAAGANFETRSYNTTNFGIDFKALIAKGDAGVSKKRTASGKMYHVNWSKLEKCLKDNSLFNNNV